MPLTDKQKIHRKYLLTDHWKELRARAIDRDCGKCCECGESTKLQVHHNVYRQRLEDGILEDVETLCECCHRTRHHLPVWSDEISSGHFWSDFDRLEKLIENGIRNSDREHRNLPTDEQISELMELAENQLDHRTVENIIREKAGMRIILTSDAMWTSWLKQREANTRLWRWAEAKAQKLRNKKELRVR